MARSRKAYVIIGAGAAGMAAAATIRRRDPNSRITVLSNETHPPYFRPMIPYLISGEKTATEMALEGKGPFIVHGVDIKINNKAVAINTRSQSVLIDDGQELEYDKLLIATGSSPLVPAIINENNADGIYTLRTLEQAESIARRCRSTQHVVLLGGGVLNVKVALALLTLGLDVTLVEIEESVLPWLMEPDAAVLINNALINAGLKIITGCTLKRINYTPQNGIQRVELSNGQELACQLLLIAIGIQPNISLLKSTSIGLNQGVVIDSRCASNIENIYAAGDVAVKLDSENGIHTRTGLWTHAVDMGRCAGKNMVGAASTYQGSYGILNAKQVADVPFVSIGTVHTAGTDYESHVHKTKDTYRKLVFSTKGNRLIGALFLGDIAKAGLYRHLIREQMPISDIKSHIIRHRLHYGHLLSNNRSSRALLSNNRY